MIQSAVDAHFNTLRVDGIDMYFPDAFYELCDAAGLLIYHDMQYSQAQPPPAATDMEDAELRYQVL
jgi:beta-mannosidase